MVAYSWEPTVMSRLSIAISAILLALLTATPTLAQDWESVVDEKQITVITNNEDGSTREVTIWLVVVDGDGFIRSAGTRWRRSMDRDPNIVLRISGAEYPVQAERVTDKALHERVQKRFGEKYGFSNWFTGLVRGLTGGSKVYRMLPRST